MIEGAQNFGVSEEWIEFLKTVEQRPRRNVEEYCKYSDKCEIPEELPIISKEELENSEDMFAFNRIVYRMKEDTPAGTKKWLAGKELALFINQALYDPKYGIHTSLDTITPEHMAYLEDFTNKPTAGFQPSIECVGRYE